MSCAESCRSTADASAGSMAPYRRWLALSSRAKACRWLALSSRAKACSAAAETFHDLKAVVSCTTFADTQDLCYAGLFADVSSFLLSRCCRCCRRPEHTGATTFCGSSVHRPDPAEQYLLRKPTCLCLMDPSACAPCFMQSVHPPHYVSHHDAGPALALRTFAPGQHLVDERKDAHPCLLIKGCSRSAALHVSPVCTVLPLYCQPAAVQSCLTRQETSDAPERTALRSLLMRLQVSDVIDVESAPEGLSAR